MKINKSETTVGMWNATCQIRGKIYAGAGYSALEALSDCFAIINWNLYGIK